MKKFLSILLTLTLCLGLAVSAFAEGDTFDPTLTIKKTANTITVTMNATPEGKTATLTIDCGNWYSATVTDSSTGNEVESTFADGNVSFKTTGGTYVIERVNEPYTPPQEPELPAPPADTAEEPELPTVPEVAEEQKTEIIEALTDVTEDDWYADAVAWAVGTELMTGYGEGVFAPEDDLSRGMLVQILYNLEKRPETDGEGFPDVTETDWCADAAAWAKEVGVTKGNGDGSFGGENAITRQELVVMLCRYADQLGISVAASGSLADFPDAADVDDWAVAAMQWAVGEGLIKGNDDGTLNPLGTATRAQVAIVFQRLLDLIHR